MFATLEGFCPEDAEADESFQYLVDTTSFELPKVRFEFDVSPPPPPPSTLSMYEILVRTDPHGFQYARAYLDDIFPRLSDVATSSMGATVGENIAKYTVTPNQITKAYLSSNGMTKDGLGARVIESKHTGRWRPACKMLWRLFDDHTKASAGKLSKAYLEGNPHFDPDYLDGNPDSMYDRNLMLYAMLEIKMSLDKDSLSKITFSTIGMYDFVCGEYVAGHRVPVEREMFGGTYLFDDGFDLDTFSPIVGHGSLESMQSAYMGYAKECRPGFAKEDLTLQLFCNGIEGAGREMNLQYDTEIRQELSPFLIQRDRLCNPASRISIEETLAKPPHFGGHESLVDTARRSKLAIDGLVVAGADRGQEKLSMRRAKLNMRSFVYITSSTDPAVRPGMHRLLDLPIFDDRSCNKMPGVNCAPWSPNTANSAFRPPELILNPYEAHLTSFEADKDGHHWTGRQMMLKIRCSSYIDKFTSDQHGCRLKPYYNLKVHDFPCYDGNLNLVSEPVFYSSEYWVRQALTQPRPRPPPPPPYLPPPSTPPPLPRLPPSPNRVYEQSQIMAEIRVLEEQACTSVYYLTTTTRCERLAAGLTASVLYDKISPPLPPPGDPTILLHLPPSPPPTPFRPTDIRRSPISGAKMSTMRVPTLQPHISQRRPDLYNDGFYVSTLRLRDITTSMRTIQQNQAVKCSDFQTSSPLPCVSGAFATNCVSGMRHCGTDDENSDRPFVDLTLASIPATRKSRLWSVQINLPDNEELADLFYHSSYPTVGGHGYNIDVFRQDGSNIPCMKQFEQADAAELTTDRTITHLCAGGDAKDSHIHDLDQVHRVRITLIGTYRQIWLKNIEVLEVGTENYALSLRSPMPPPLPGLPPNPPSHPLQSCEFASQYFYKFHTFVRQESCGITYAECCARTREFFPFANAFEFSDFGCCTLINRDMTMRVEMVRNTEKWGFLGVDSGTGNG